MEWKPPIPLQQHDLTKLGNFPIECLPYDIGAFVEALACSTQTPLEMGAALALGEMAAIFQGRYRVLVTPDWKETVCLYVVAVAAPGEKKSSVLRNLTQPLYEYEAKMQRMRSLEIEKNRQEKKELEAAVSLQNKRMRSGAGDENDEKTLAALNEQLNQWKEIYPLRLIADDATPEKLVNLMAQNGGMMTHISAEGGVFDMMAGRYSGTANIDVYLKGHPGDPIRIDRIGRESDIIDNPRLTMVLTIQPQVLNGFMQTASFQGRGLCARFLFAICRSKVGYRDVAPPPIDVEIRKKYHDFLLRKLEQAQEEGVEKEIKLSQATTELRVDFHRRVESRLAGEWELMTEWGNKYVGATLRIAGLLHAAQHDAPAEAAMQPETLEAAIKISEYLSGHAIIAHELMGADPRETEARYLLEKLESIDIDITKRDLYQTCHGHYKRVSDMDGGLELLYEHGFIEIVKESTGGRPTEMIYRNPLYKKFQKVQMPQ